MTVPAARRLGPYEFIGRIGAGGMGEVYRARDTRLGREVAIKLLPPEVSADADRLRRFEKEARAASSLNHPNIVTIHEVERIDSTSFIVMELVDGKTLRDLVAEGGMPVRRLLAIAVQVADGLARAHSAGIVHRDLKPENVMVTKDGLVKILDFGLAKLAHPDQDGGQLTQGPTVSGGTAPGVVMGTVGYMSPEQASGHPVDFRSDQFSFGSLLYEMATGKGPFRRATAAQTLAAIIQDEAEPIAAVNAKIPAPLRWIIERCLSKEPRERYASTEDLARELVGIRDHLSETSFSGESVAVTSVRRRRTAYLATGAALLAVIAAAAYLRRSPKPPERLPIRASLLVPENKGVEHLALSPDGRRLAFTTGDSVWIWALDSVAPQRVTPPGTVDFSGLPGLPFWSPDGRFLAFFSDGKMKKVDAALKTIQTICDSEPGGGGTWGPDGMILFAPGSMSPLYRVSASGGPPVAVTRLDASRHEASHRYPFFLPDGRHFLYMATDLTSAPEDPPNSIRVASLDGKVDRAVVPIASAPAYASGRLIYVRDDTLVARPFDPGRLEVGGEPVLLAQDVMRFAASERLIVIAHPTPKTRSSLLWVDRSGKPAGALGEPALFRSARLSPDGRRVAVDIVDPIRSARDIWIYDIATGKRTKFVSGTPTKLDSPGNPVWSPEGDRIAYFSYGKGRSTTVAVKAISGASEEVLLQAPYENWPDDWSSDGRFLSFGTLPTGGKRNFQIWALSMSGDRRASAFATEATVQENSRFSPDARWIAYASDESGRFEIFVRAFPGPGGKLQVSTAGGSQPRWRRDGRELFYLSSDNRIMAVPIQLGALALEAGSPSPLFPVRLRQVSPEDSVYEVSGDGRRFLVNSASGEDPPRTLTLLTDWAALLKSD